MRFASFDIETTNLRASYGRILCACFKFSDEDKVRSYSARRYRDEPRMLRQIVKAYNSCDVTITWNGKLFDIPYVNARLMVRRKDHKGITTEPPVILNPAVKQIDLMYMSKKLRTQGNKLDYASKDLKAKTRKFDVDAEYWVKAMDGDREAFDRILKHCQYDVLLTEEMLEILKPYVVRITR